MKKATYRLAWIVIAVSLFLINAPLFASERGDSIESYAKRTYIFVTYLKGTVVTVQDGTVTLRGEASSTAEKDLITEYARDVDGVRDVKNEMTVAMKPGEKTMGEDFIDDVSITAMVKTTLLYHRSTSGLNMNPVLIKDRNPVAVDARILVSPIAVPSSLHLVIGPYPEEEASHMVSEDGRRIFIRPVKPEDAPLFTALFKVLSPTTIYYRFFGPVKELQPEMLARFTQIDYDREIALVAIDEDSETDRMLGVARIIGDPDGMTGEFAVLVGDPWQGKDIGSNLLDKCLSIAKKQNFKTIHGIVLQENRNMLALGRKLGFEIKRVPGGSDNELVIRF